MAVIGRINKVQLPGTSGQYDVVDTVTRQDILCATIYSTSAPYSQNAYVWYPDILSGKLYKAIADMDVSGTWNPAKWVEVTITQELSGLRAAIKGGVSYIGVTSTLLYDGASDNPITIGGNSRTVEAGNLVIQQSIEYTKNKAYHEGMYIVHDDGVTYDTYKAKVNITAAENTSWDAVKNKFQAIKTSGNIEFLFDGTNWAELGASSKFGALAFKDSASGSFTLQTESKTATYTKPTGSGSVSVNTYTPTKKQIKATASGTAVGANGTASAITGFGTHPSDTVHDTPTPTTSKLTTTSIYGVKSTTQNVSKVTAATATSNVAIAGTTPVVYGTADVGTAVYVGTAIDGETTFVTSAIKSASLTGTTTFATSGISASVSNGCLTFSNVGTGSVGISTEPAATDSFELHTESIKPAKAADTTRTFTPIASTTTIKGINTITNYDVAVKDDTSTTVATGAISTSSTGASVMTGITPGGEKTFLTGIGEASKSTVLTGVKVTAQPTVTLSLSDTGTSTVDVVTGLTSGTESKSVTVGTENGSISVTVPKTTGSVTVS